MVDEVRRDPATGQTVVRRSGGGGSTLLLVLLVILALAALAYFTGFINVNPGQAPKLVGGEAPSVTTGKVVTGTHKEVVDVPDVHVQKPSDATNK